MVVGKYQKILADQGNADWHFKVVDTSIDNGIATITINRPEAMNALNETVMATIRQCIG